MNDQELEHLILKYICLIAVLVLLIINFQEACLMIGFVLSAFSNIFYAAALAYVINIIMSRFEKLLNKSHQPIIQRFNRPISLILSLLTILLILYTLIYLIVPEFFNAIQMLTSTIPVYFEKTKLFLEAAFKDIPSLSEAIGSLEIDWKNLSSNMLQFAGNGIGSVIGTTFNIVSIITNSLFNFLLVFIFSIYLLLDKNRFSRMYHRLIRIYLSEHKQHRLNETLIIIHHSFSSFIGGQCIEAVILGSLCALGMLLFKMPYAIMVGILVGVINIIPIVGAYIGGAIGVFMVFTVNPYQAILFLIYLIILQQFESNVIYPKVVGNSVGLPSVYVLAAVMIFGTLAGIFGMFLGIPTVASIYKLAKLYLVRKEEELGLTQTEDHDNP